MKKTSIILLLIILCAFTNVANSNNFAIQVNTTHLTEMAKPIKRITVYTWNGSRFNVFGQADLYKYDRGYFIQFVNTSIQLHVYSKNQNGFNSWSVDNWGIYYYYNI